MGKLHQASSEQVRVFIGYDPRQPLAYNVLQHSIVEKSSVPVSITPLILHQLPISRRGLTQFTYSRFLVPYLCGFKGKAIFMDADMVVDGDVAELIQYSAAAVNVMQEQPAFEWASMMVFDCEKCTTLTPEFIEDPANGLFDFAWADEIGSIPTEWNHCVGYVEPKGAKLYHFTQGLPCWFETSGEAEDAAWLEARQRLTHTVTWKELMGGSVHAEPVMRRILARYGYGLK